MAAQFVAVEMGHTDHLERSKWDFPLTYVAHFVCLGRRSKDLRVMHWVSLSYAIKWLLDAESSSIHRLAAHVGAWYRLLQDAMPII
jgi:hypothetical protein